MRFKKAFKARGLGLEVSCLDLGLRVLVLELMASLMGYRKSWWMMMMVMMMMTMTTTVATINVVACLDFSIALNQSWKFQPQQRSQDRNSRARKELETSSANISGSWFRV